MSLCLLFFPGGDDQQIVDPETVEILLPVIDPVPVLRHGTLDAARADIGELPEAVQFLIHPEENFIRVDKPTRLDRARALGYKAKQGYVIVRARVRKGSFRKRAIVTGRRAKRKGINQITVGKSLQRMAEERTAKRYPNLEVLNSYWVGADGQQEWYEVILVDPAHPVIKSDKKINWICYSEHKNRVYRGKTSAGQKGRGMRHTGKGAEKARPSVRANNRRIK